MRVVILAGGFGTRISEESHLKPKPMIEIGERPILWHIMKTYSHYGFDDFIVCLGYKGYCIKEYFAHYYLYESDVTFDFRCENQQVIHTHQAEPWQVTIVNTGIDTMTGGGPSGATETLVYKVFSDGKGGSNLGGSAAQSVLLLIMVIGLTAVQFRFIERKVSY